MHNTQSRGIIVDAVGFRYGNRTVLHDISFAIQPGTIVGLLGSNGAGKTTLCRIISTVLPLQEGSCMVAGKDVRRESIQVRRSIAVVPQGSTLNLELTVAQNIMTYLVMHGLKVGEAHRRLRSIARRFSLDGYLDKKCMGLSGGFRRRVQIARAFATDASCFLLDEASAGLDPVAKKEMWNLIRERADTSAILLITQALDEAELCDRVIFLNEGKVVVQGTPDALKQIHAPSRLILGLREAMEWSPAIQQAMAAIGVRVLREDGLTLELAARGYEDLGGVISALYAVGLPIAKLEIAPPTMEEVFLTVLGGSTDASDHTRILS
ncbi:MAG: ABC transporter ATP-binding protein [Bacilli bacterium]